jgi:small subunit ribosomal protein S1
MPVVDEGWWESILSEDERRPPARLQTVDSKQKLTPDEKALMDGPVVASASAPQVNWEVVKKLYEEDCAVDVPVTGHNRGGLLVGQGEVAGFVPFSHLVNMAGKDGEVDRDRCLETYTGKTLRVKVIECVPEDGRVVFSERAALTPPGKRTELFRELHVGEHIMGRVTNITDFGVFVDLGGVEGLIHLSELSWGRVGHPDQIVRLGDEVKAQVLEMSVERNRVALSLKRLIPNPWTHAESEFPIGQVLTAVVTSVMSYGAFARLDAGVEGLIHASEMPLESNLSPREFLAEGQQVEVRVLHVDAAHQRLGFSMRLDGK